MSNTAYQRAVISIHALREEGDLPHKRHGSRHQSISIHALREEGDETLERLKQAQQTISIHALREEGDMLSLSHRWLLLFLSTPSVRRATLPDFHLETIRYISIHALREEGDFAQCC